MASGEAVTFAEEIAVDGQPRSYQTRKRPVRDRRGKLRGVVGVAIDVTEELLLRRQLENAHEKLSDREMQTLVMIASGKRLSDIAEELTLSPKTVSVYRARVLEKLGLTNNSEMTVYAIRSGLVGN